MTDEHAPRADACVGCERLVPQRDDLGLCPDCAAKHWIVT
jgi:RNA polymerase subunit RPABC4/transcription elongation factor Spt4